MIQRALRLYLHMAKRREIDAAYARAYGEPSHDAFEEFADLMEGQRGPAE